MLPSTILLSVFQQELDPQETCGRQGGSALISASDSVSFLLQTRAVMCSGSSTGLFCSFDSRATELNSFNSRWANAQHKLWGSSLLGYSLTPVQKLSKKNRSKYLTLQICLSLDNLCSDVPSKRKNNDARSQLHMMASNLDISHLSHTAQSLHNSCSCVC